MQSRTANRALVMTAVGGGIVALFGGIAWWLQRGRRAAAIARPSWHRVEETLRISAPPETVYAFWSEPTNLIGVMESVADVAHTPDDARKVHWVQKGPMGFLAEWDAEMEPDRDHGLIQWRTTEESPVDAHGRIQLSSLDGNRATLVNFIAEFQPPGMARFFWNPVVERLLTRRIKRDLQRVRHALEAPAESFH